MKKQESQKAFKEMVETAFSQKFLNEIIAEVNQVLIIPSIPIQQNEKIIGKMTFLEKVLFTASEKWNKKIKDMENSLSPNKHQIRVLESQMEAKRKLMWSLIKSRIPYSKTPHLGLREGGKIVEYFKKNKINKLSWVLLILDESSD